MKINQILTMSFRASCFGVAILGCAMQAGADITVLSASRGLAADSGPGGVGGGGAIAYGFGYFERDFRTIFNFNGGGGSAELRSRISHDEVWAVGNVMGSSSELSSGSGSCSIQVNLDVTHPGMAIRVTGQVTSQLQQASIRVSSSAGTHIELISSFGSAAPPIDITQLLPAGRYTISLAAAGAPVSFYSSSRSTFNSTISYVPRCASDFTADGGVDGQDVTAFFEYFERGDALADINNDGGVDNGDVGAFFDLWIAGQC